MIRSELVVTKRTPLAPRGLVAAEHPLGADVGAAILARGGNAVDAAVATAFAMTVAEPFMSTIGGSGTMLIHLEREASTVALDFNARAPLAASESMFRIVGGSSGDLFNWSRVEHDANVMGYRSVGVPGSVAGLTLALQRWGTMELADVLAPAISLARTGFVPDWYQALTTARALEELRAFPESARTYLRNGGIHRPPSIEPGDRVTFPELAASLALIARDGADVFYRGAIAQAIVDDMKAHGGLVTREDLAAYQVRTADPLRGRYRDLDLALPPGSTGGTTALQILNVLDALPADRVGYTTARGLHHRALAVRQAMLDRFALMADPELVKVPWDRLASREYAHEVAATVRTARGGSGPTRPAAPARGRAARRRASRGDGECTTHVSVIDKQRNMVALTHTALSIYGSRVVVKGTGILLNNGMMWFDPEPGHANSIAPGKRALVNMVPALVFKRGRPYLTVGAPGGRRILAAIPQVIANVADGRGSLQAAVEAPRLYTDGGPLIIDDRVGAKLLAELARLGWEVAPRTETYATLNFAKPVAIRVTPRGLEAGLDQFRPAAAAGH
ncbi:MAG: gamma-glutamyltransferase [Candidatus Rokubacteria bacterium]|nr:gamma-glutamyltransferase [Candidatus Rokubacteria bacterium]MBI3827804.1 gamma-glutamyltransferase [Candidatus Rokubacteria bacterium]